MVLGWTGGAADVLLHFFATISKHNYLIQCVNIIAVKSIITLFILQNPIHQPFSFYASLFLNVLNTIVPSLMNCMHYKRQLYHDSFVFVPVSVFYGLHVLYI